MRRILLFAVFLVLVVGSANAYLVSDEPKLDAHTLTKSVQAGKIQELKIVILNAAKHEWSERGTLEKEIAYNMSLNAYNLTLELESDEIKILTERVRIPVLPANSQQVVSFQISVPNNLSGEHTLTLRVNYERIRYVDVTGNLSGSYEVDYYYRDETVEIPIKVEILQTAEPEFRVYPLKSTLYASEQDRIALQLANVGLSDARNVEVTLEGIEVIQPGKVIVPHLGPSSITVVEFDVVAPEREGELNVKARINYTYFDGERWIDGFDEVTFKIFVEKIGRGIEFSIGKDELERGESGVIDLFVMNNYLYPIKGLELVISEPDGIDFSATKFLIGYLNSGEVKVIGIPYNVDENADFGNGEIMIQAKYTILASKLEEREITKSIKIVVKENPDFIVLNKPIVYHGENIVKLEVMNVGGYAKNVHFKLNPSPGIKLKMPEAYIAELKRDERANISFRVDVDDDVIAGNEYRIDITYKAENTEGEEISDSFYAYLFVEEKSWVERNTLIIVAAVIAIAILLAMLKRR
ncbi:hypothetical protein Asulf_00484 [Archaeoglobus sulfaticallidus PM70-1]|uniref:S-layer domain protein n=1 Tax=Archaeoglobus sulfaticallidus PM70-1 TaxID=387631 RepID=N0BJ88_9EURY|nr:hypothetical protein [Archaeoglobus sulfaticallidus]AGK60511.1 hypothetical protein Asulf_00484 [Archaeoglobus sulfaticallidus PM70-1]